ncbi:hypothetical protein [Sorangium sp. So ce385]|uniref:hypothetical protein n=1 Tax=Sorangium sp. So ce385 TaxID=3133308 RepID=UPI003F5BCF4B
MSYFYSMRGWLEIEPDRFSCVAERITAARQSEPDGSKRALYMEGWSWAGKPINWTRYVFYGADVTEEGLQMVSEVLAKLTELRLGLSGYFHAQGEDGERNFVYRVNNDVVTCEPAGPLLAL